MQEVIGSTPIFSTQEDNKPELQQISGNSGFLIGKTLPKYLNCENNNLMLGQSKLYTTPFLSKGKEVKLVPKGSTKSAEQAKLNWYIDFSFLDANTQKMKRVRVTKDGNRIKNPAEKLEYFTNLLAAYKALLENGYNPFDEQNNSALKKNIISITLNEAKPLFKSYHENKGSRKKTIQTYLSKINYFINFIGAEKKVNEITDFDITNFLNEYEATKKWTGVTYIAARTTLSNFFNFLKRNKFIQVSPVIDIETRKKIKTELHQVFSDDDFDVIMNWLKIHDQYTLLFVKAIYYTCIRPKELRNLQLKNIDFATNTITVPAHIAKNKKALPVNIDITFKQELQKFNIKNFPGEYFLFGSTKSFISKNMIGENTPYERFQTCLEKNGLLNKNYTLYSFKHLSNVRKFKSGWTIAEICSANRHSSIVETETYLKELLKFVHSDKIIPPI